jgi:hypothetical protein
MSRLDHGAFLIVDLVLDNDPRRSRLFQFPNRPQDAHRVAVSGVGIDQNRDTYGIGDSACHVHHIAEV